MIKAFPKIFAIGTNYIENIFDNEVEITEKIDGCFNYESRIMLGDGSFEKIGKIVNNKLNLEVISYNEKTEKLEVKKIIGWHKNGISDDWLRIKIKGFNGQYQSIKCTPNHKIMIEGKGWIEANEIRENDNVFCREMVFNPIVKQIIYGIMLGDASICNGRLYYGHSNKQKSLTLLIKRLLNGFSVYSEDYISGYGSKCFRIRSSVDVLFKEIEAKCKINNKKEITNEWLNEITPISLAFWFMDDGSSSFGKSNKQRGKVTFATHGFSEKSVDKLIRMLLSKFNLRSTKHYSRGFYISLDTESSEKFLWLVHLYIEKSVKYKLPKSMRIDYCYLDNDFEFINSKKLVPRKVLGIERYIPSNKTKYDITIQNNSNYFIQNVLVHNSMFCFGKIKGEVYVRSKGAQLFFENPDKMFSEAVDYIDSIQDKIADNTIYFSEYLKKPRHNILKYDRIPKNHLILFGVSDNTGTFFKKSYENIAKVAEELGIEAVPLIYKGKVSKPEEIFKLVEKDSILGGTKVEGVVVKNYKQPFLLGGQPIPLMMGKYVSEKFKEVHRENWGKDHTAGGRWQTFKESFKTEARWEKSIQHLKEKGELENSPRDIGKLIKEIKNDIAEEEKENIKDFLWKEFGDEVLRGSTKGFPEYYKERLLKKSFK